MRNIFCLFLVFVHVSVICLPALAAPTKKLSFEEKLNLRRQEQAFEIAFAHAKAALEATQSPINEKLEFLSDVETDRPKIEYIEQVTRQMNEQLRKAVAGFDETWRKTPSIWGSKLNKEIQAKADLLQKKMSKMDEMTKQGSNINEVDAFMMVQDTFQTYAEALFLAYKQRDPSAKEIEEEGTLNEQLQHSKNARKGKVGAGILLSTAFVAAYFIVGKLAPDSGTATHIVLGVPTFVAMTAALFKVLLMVIMSEKGIRASQQSAAFKTLEENFLGRLIQFHGQEGIPAKAQEALSSWFPTMLQDYQKNLFVTVATADSCKKAMIRKEEFEAEKLAAEEAQQLEEVRHAEEMRKAFQHVNFFNESPKAPKKRL